MLISQMNHEVIRPPYHPAEKEGENLREAGILLHISSLPGDFGTGDFGPSAETFIDFLATAGMKVWQVLPLSVTSEGTGYSPYSSWSAFAGNTMFIDPWQLADAGLLDTQKLKRRKVRTSSKARFNKATVVKNTCLVDAFECFSNNPPNALKKEFHAFVEKEKMWLEDYALYALLLQHFNFRPWHSWPGAYRDRDLPELNAFSRQHAKALEQLRFNQFIFSKQWCKIKNYANDRGITIFGDVPIYIDYHSADVWAHPELFRLRKDKTMETVAGVPPDYFNAEGQRWGMPVFDWHTMENNNYGWWISRLKKNLEWFDLLRLDHFRGFSAFWEIPAKAESASEGNWTEGPGYQLFDMVHKTFPSMPFVAEDLGMIDQAVYDLRDHYELPGMKVLQFGFGEDMETSEHHPSNIPYHAVAYTGTHDNNTIKGWYSHELDNEARNRVSRSFGKNISKRRIHKELISAVFESAARLTIIPMQDFLGLGVRSRMNYPSTTAGNWHWKIKKSVLRSKNAEKLHALLKSHKRCE
ncbi:MAG: 4-alpha-glucanotransferase [Bacteroidales bacterium]|nr:4-alpha-glucanotransferase [Bacteroidales bacterium]